MTCSSGTAEKHEEWLVLSNLAFLMPTMACLWRYKEGTLTGANTMELVPVLLFVTFFSSWNYHACRSNLADEGKIDMCENQPALDENTAAFSKTCPRKDYMYLNMDYNEARIFDVLFAVYATFLVTLQSVPLKTGWKSSSHVLGLLWITASLLLLDDHIIGETVSMMIVLFALLLILIFWYQSAHYQLKDYKRRNIWWSLGLLFSAGSIGFQRAPDQYWLFHSLWHIMGSLAGTSFIMGGVDQTDHIMLPASAWSFAWDPDAVYTTTRLNKQT